MFGPGREWIMSRDSTGARARFLAAIEKLPEVADGPIRLCGACVMALPVQRAGIATHLAAGGLEVLAASDEVAAGVEWAQVMVGEGPGMDAVLGGGPVSVPNLAYPDGRWPIFLSEIADSGVGAMFALPLQLGAIKVGVLDLYCDAAGRMDGADFADAVAVADLVTAILLTVGRDGRIAEPLGPWWDQPLSTREVHQATGMVMAQLGVDAQVAYARLQGFAFASRRLLHDVAHDVVERILRFDTGPGLGRDVGGLVWEE
jgi:hypothetical protein